MSKRNGLEKHSFLFEVRAGQDEKHGNIITGRPIVYGKATDICGHYQEIIESGALDEADLKDVRFLVNHNTEGIPLARSRNNNENSTMQLIIVPMGMDIRADMDTDNNAESRALYSAVQRGDISGMSFMFAVADEWWEDLDSDYPTRHITKISNVVEVSAVTFPAYEATEIYARGKETLENARAAVETARAKRAENTVDTVELEKLKAKYLYKI